FGYKNLADIFYYGRGVDADLPRALLNYRLAATNGNRFGMYALGLMFDSGKGTTADHKTACDWYEQAAKQKHALATNNLAACYYSAEGRPQNVAKALRLYERAAARGSGHAFMNLGDHYATLPDGDADQKRASTYYQKSADAGFARGMVEYGLRLYEGVGVKSDTEAACEWFVLAAASAGSSLPVALNNAAYCTSNGIGRSRNERAASSMFLEAAEAGNLDGMRNIAFRLDRGLGVKRDRKKAAHWFRTALKSGNTSALNEFISQPFEYSKAFRRELQRILRKEKLYDGPVDGRVTELFDEVLWTRTIGEAGEKTSRLAQSFTRVARAGVKNGLLVRVCRKKSDKPQRLMVMNHGLTSVRKDRKTLRPNACGPVAEHFANLGYVVAFPIRRGYGATGGRFVEGATTRRCGKAHQFVKAGKEMAADIKATLQHLLKTENVEDRNAVIFGHSGGGWGTVALSSENLPEVATYINFSGVHGSRKGRPNGNCGPASVSAAMGRFGRSSRTPSLWLYVENDSYVGPAFANRMKRAFVKAGGNAKLHMFPDYQDEGHYLVGDEGLGIWAPIVTDWLKKHASPG
ncbi:MAG: dienelactone hydrolase family protein, partial [Pseudomonadota bacterium]